MVRHAILYLGAAALGGLIAGFTDYGYFSNWEAWVLSAPYWVVGGILVQR